MYNIQELDYDYDELEPFLSARTLGIHYENHYKNYVNNLNKYLSSINYNGNYSLEELVKNIDKFPLYIRDEILYNAGGVLNHNLYFENISPNKSNKPENEIKNAIDLKYGSFDNFKKEFKKKANLITGSGYTFLVLKNNELDIINTSNQETPFAYGFTPIMTIDLWEHAYYLDYQSNKQKYIENFFYIVDFKKINEIYKKTQSKKSI
ncbi:MAG: superoxide dismutase [Bacilli bacterium]